MAVDYGDQRTGIAICDALEVLSTPVCVIKEWNQDRLIEKILALVKERYVEKIIVGLPLNMDDTEGERAQKCREFGEKLKKNSNLPLEMVDERLTTVEAYEYLDELNIFGKKRKDMIDAVSAAVILKDYIG